MKTRHTGRDAFLSLLADEGIRYLFGNPGTIELPIIEALGRHAVMRFVLGLQEAVVLAMADGYSRASGRLSACNVHVAPGLGNAMGSLLNYWTTRRARLAQETGKHAASAPIDPRYLMRELSEALPRDGVVLEEALTAMAPLLNLVPYRDARSFFGLASGGVGFAMGGAIGVSPALPGRPIVAAIGDGSALYTIQALWTAAHRDLPVTYAIINNRSYRVLKERTVSMRGAREFTGMDLRAPEIDFTGLGRSLGVESHRRAGERAQAQATAAGDECREPCP